MTLRNKYEIYSSGETKDDQHTSVLICIPEIVWGTFCISNDVFYRSYWQEINEGLFFNFETSAGALNKHYCCVYKFIILGFGIEVSKNHKYDLLEK